MHSLKAVVLNLWPSGQIQPNEPYHPAFGAPLRSENVMMGGAVAINIATIFLTAKLPSHTGQITWPSMPAGTGACGPNLICTGPEYDSLHAQSGPGPDPPCTGPGP